MNEKLENFVRNYLSLSPIPATTRYEHNRNIVITIQMVDKGFVVGYQDFRMPKEDENSIYMQYSDIHFEKKQARVGKTTKHRIDDAIEKMLGALSPDTDIVPIGKAVQETKSVKQIQFAPTYHELLTTMKDVISMAEQIYFVNSGLKDAQKKGFIKN